MVEEESREIGGQATAVRAGTEGSNPACSSGESRANPKKHVGDDVGKWHTHIAIVSIDNQPRLNALTRQMLSKLGGLWDELERDPTCR